MSLLNTVVPALWIGALILVLVGRAAGSWLRYKDAARYAREAERLAKATETRPALTLIPSPPGGQDEREPQPQPFPAAKAEG